MNLNHIPEIISSQQRRAIAAGMTRRAWAVALSDEMKARVADGASDGIGPTCACLAAVTVATRAAATKPQPRPEGGPGCVGCKHNSVCWKTDDECQRWQDHDDRDPVEAMWR